MVETHRMLHRKPQGHQIDRTHFPNTIENRPIKEEEQREALVGRQEQQDRVGEEEDPQLIEETADHESVIYLFYKCRQGRVDMKRSPPQEKLVQKKV